MDANDPDGTDHAETPAQPMARAAGPGVAGNELNPTALPASHEPGDTAGRRRFLKWFGVSASGVALANTIDTSKEKIEAGGERAQEEIAKLKKAYQELDDRSRLILKLILILSGLDFITAL